MHRCGRSFSKADSSSLRTARNDKVVGGAAPTLSQRARNGGAAFFTNHPNTIEPLQQMHRCGGSFSKDSSSIRSLGMTRWLVEQRPPFRKRRETVGQRLSSRGKINANVKGGGQECPPHTGKSRFLRAFSLRCERLGMTRWLGEQRPPFRKERKTVGQPFLLIARTQSSPFNKCIGVGEVSRKQIPRRYARSE